MRKVYIVSEFGGEYENRWEHAIVVCNTKEKAKELQKEIEDEYNEHGVISNDLYDKLLDKLWDYNEKRGVNPDDAEETEVEDLYKLFPEYSIKDLQKANRRYYDWRDWHGVDIEEVDFYE
jgi:hypothetical protein